MEKRGATVEEGAVLGDEGVLLPGGARPAELPQGHLHVPPVPVVGDQPLRSDGDGSVVETLAVSFDQPSNHVAIAGYRQLRPLWMMLNERFPQDALNRVPVSPLRDALSLRSVHRRYYRRSFVTKPRETLETAFHLQKRVTEGLTKWRDALPGNDSGSMSPFSRNPRC